MKPVSACRCLALPALLALAPVTAALPVADFALADQHGVRHQLHNYRAATALVLMVQGNGCPIVRNALTDLASVRAQFAEHNIAFLMINANPQDNADNIRAEAEEWGIDLPILVDETQTVGTQLALTRTAETLVLVPESQAWRIAYRGPINDRLAYERQRQTASRHYLADALDAVLAGTEPATTTVDAIGCLINFSPAAPEPSSGVGTAADHAAH